MHFSTHKINADSYRSLHNRRPLVGSGRNVRMQGRYGGQLQPNRSPDGFDRKIPDEPSRLLIPHTLFSTWCKRILTVETSGICYGHTIGQCAFSAAVVLGHCAAVKQCRFFCVVDSEWQ